MRLEYMELNRIYDNLYVETLKKGRYSFIRWQYPDGSKFWNDVEAICGVTNLRARDAIHMATALGTSADLIITCDHEFVRIAEEELPYRFQVPVALPEDIDAALEDIGFVIDDNGQATRQ